MKSILQECCSSIAREVSRFPWTDRTAYADWLAQTYYYVRHSTRLLACAAARFSQNERGDALHYRFAAHMAEEKKHERLALHDLKCLGKSIEELPEHPSTRMFYEPQYFKIEHQTPLALFGYILPLEAVGPALGARVVEQVTGAFGSSCASFLKLHAAEDVDHLDKALRILDSILEEERRPIEENLRQTAFAYGCMLVDMRTRVESTRAS